MLAEGRNSPTYREEESWKKKETTIDGDQLRKSNALASLSLFALLESEGAWGEW